MRRLCIIALALGLLPAQAVAACGGQDLMAALAREDPPAHTAILARADRVANGRGVFWRVSAPGGAASHLFGTLHTTAAAARGLAPRVGRALARARIVLVETTPAEQARLARRMAGEPSWLIDRDGPTLAARLPDRLERRARRLLAARGLDWRVANRLKPWVLIAALATPGCERAALASGAATLDQAIAAAARARGVPVAGLETAEAGVAAFARMPEAAVSAMLADAVAGAAAAEDTRATLESLYRRGRIAAILEFTVWQAEQSGLGADSRETAAAFERALLEDRNRAWLGRIVEAVRAGGAFVAVGALHLPGETGLVTLLRAAGFEVTRAAPR